MSEPAPAGSVASAEDLLGPLEAACMRELWRGGPASVGAVLEALNAARDRPLAYTTVMTVLARLHQKGRATRSPEGRGFAYAAAVDEAELVDRSSRRAVDAVLSRYGTSALRHFAAELQHLDADTRSALERLASGEP